MSTPQLTPNPMVSMLGPDGTVASVPGANVQAALGAGAKIAVHVYAPDGTPSFIPHDRLSDALKAGATAGPPQAQQDVQPHGFAQSLVAPIPMMAKQIYHNFADAPRNAEEAQGVGFTPADPNATGMAKVAQQASTGLYRTAVAPTSDAITHAVKDARGSLADKMAVPLDAAEGVPAIGGVVSALRGAMGQYASGDKMGAAGSVLGNAIPIAMGAGIASKLGGPDLNPTLSPVERSAVQVTKAINPAAMAYPETLKAVTNQTGNVLKFAQDNNLKISDSRDFAKVAKMAADQTQTHFDTNVLGPHADLSLSDVAKKLGQSAPQDVSEGELAGTNPNLGMVNSRMNAINQELKSSFRKPTPGQTASALAGPSDAELLSERTHLADILHQSLGDLNGMDPRDVQGIRQRAGELRTLSGETQAGANQVTRGAGIQEVGAGSALPVSKAAVLDKFIQMLPGQDAESVAARKLRTALQATPIQPTGLEDAYPGATNPMTPNANVTAYQQDLARRAAISNDQINNPADTIQAKAAAKNQRSAAAQALQDAIDRNNGVQPKAPARVVPRSYGLSRYLNAKDLNP